MCRRGQASVRVLVTAAVCLLLGMVCAYGGEPRFEAETDRTCYRPFDTVVVVIETDIPRGYYLCSNPLGPGIGRPLRIRPRGPDGIVWLALRRSEHEKMGSESDWVWAFRRRATHFLLAVIAEHAQGTLPCTLRIEGLLCREACIVVDETCAFDVCVDSTADEEAFDAAPFAHRRYVRSESMSLHVEPRAAQTPPQVVPSALPVATAVHDSEDSQADEKRRRATKAHHVTQSPSSAPQAAESEDEGCDTVRACWSYVPREHCPGHNQLSGPLVAATWYVVTDIPAGAAIVLLLTVVGAVVGIRFRRRAAARGEAAVARVSLLLVVLIVVSGVGSAIWLLVADRPWGWCADPRQGKRGVAWREFSTRALHEAHARGDHALVDFTGASCYGCRYNREAVIHSRGVANLMAHKGVIRLVADMTDHNAAADSLMTRLGTHERPLIALFPGDDPQHPVLLHRILRRSDLVEVLERLSERR